VPDAPGASVRGFGLYVVLISIWVTVPVFVAAGGLGFVIILLRVADEIFCTVILRQKVVPEVIMLTGVVQVGSSV
jgi:hypothetical protein